MATVFLAFYQRTPESQMLATLVSPYPMPDDLVEAKEAARRAVRIKHGLSENHPVRIEESITR